MIERDAKYYTTGYSGKDPKKAPFFIRAKEAFDGEKGDLNASLIDAFNELLRKDAVLKKCGLVFPEGRVRNYPERIVIINASGDDLPTSYETARVFEEHLAQIAQEIPVSVVNTREELAFFSQDPSRTLFVSQCVDKKVYDIDKAKELEEAKGVVVPGVITAPGGIFSDKALAYDFLSEGSLNWRLVARYREVPYENKSARQVAEGILRTVDEMADKTGDDKFFIKPKEGGGGLGGFRISKVSSGYYMPDLSKVTGRTDRINPTYIDIDTGSEAKMKELGHIYDIFCSDPVTRTNYINVELARDKNGEVDIPNLKKYLLGSREKREKKIRKMVISREAAEKVLEAAIEEFEKKFNKRYSPLVNEHMDFGLWGLRAHFRVSSYGIKLETIYHRIFQLAFTQEGIGYVGSDNISNKQTGDLEIMRLGPIDKPMLEAIGGEEALFDTLWKGVRALTKLQETAEEKVRDKLPLRLQLDLASLSRKIGEGNADTARGMCLASRWKHFIDNAEEWLEDSLKYYSWRKDLDNGDPR